jgi:hypothetical protein
MYEINKNGINVVALFVIINNILKEHMLFMKHMILFSTFKIFIHSKKIL